jgi:hypothetical protein
MVRANCGSDTHRTGYSGCKNYCSPCAQSGDRQKLAQNGATCPYRVCSTCGSTGHAYAARVATKRISSTTALTMKCANDARNMATTRYNGPNHDAKHAAVQRTETLGASNALSTSARNANARWVRQLVRDAEVNLHTLRRNWSR